MIKQAERTHRPRSVPDNLKDAVFATSSLHEIVKSTQDGVLYVCDCQVFKHNAYVCGEVLNALHFEKLIDLERMTSELVLVAKGGPKRKGRPPLPKQSRKDGESPRLEAVSLGVSVFVPQYGLGVVQDKGTTPGSWICWFSNTTNIEQCHICDKCAREPGSLHKILSSVQVADGIAFLSTKSLKPKASSEYLFG